MKLKDLRAGNIFSWYGLKWLLLEKGDKFSVCKCITRNGEYSGKTVPLATGIKVWR